MERGTVAFASRATTNSTSFGRKATLASSAKEPLWHLRDQKSEKNGPHAMVYLMNGDTYLGEWKNNMKHGKGTYTCARTGSVYEGEWKDDRRDGYGTFSVRVIPTEDRDLPSASRSSTPTFSASSSSSLNRRAPFDLGTKSNTASSLALLKSNRVPESRSGSSGGSAGATDDETVFSTKKTKIPKTEYPLRKVYAGGWRDDRRSGFGTYFYADGSYYEGEWEGGVKKGWGTMHYRDGSRYDGEWFDEKRHGQGILLLPNQDRYEGMWLNDQKEGPGKYIFKVRRQAYEGEWVQGTPKCGTLVDLPPLTAKAAASLAAATARTNFIDPAQAAQPANWLMLGGRRVRYPIPELGLATPHDVINKERERIVEERVKRLLRRSTGESEDELDEEDLED